MKLECIRDKFSEAVSRAEKIAGRNPTLPALSGVYLKAGDNSLTVRSTNLDLGISITLPVKVEEPGEVVVPAQVLNSFLGTLVGDKAIELSTFEATLKVETKGAKTNLKTLSLEEFPLIPEIADDLTFSLPGKDLSLGIRSVVYAASNGSMKPELASVLVTYREGELVFAATDSFRLAEKRIKAKKIPHFKQLLIPHKNALEIARIFDKESEDVSVSLGDQQVAFRKGDLYLASRTVEGTFPDYRQIVPNGAATKAVLLKEDLQNTLKTNSIFADAFNQLIFRISPAKKVFEIESKNANVGEHVALIDAALEGDDLTVSVNQRYLTDCFQSIPADSLTLSFNGQSKAILVQGVGDKSFIYLVMPMNR